MAKIISIKGKSFLVENGKAYPIKDNVVSAKTIKGKTKVKPTVEEKYNGFVEFMAKNNYKPIGKPKDTTFERKDGKVIPVKQISMSNGKTYNVSAFKPWAI